MTQTQINIIGLIILAVLFYYFQVYRPNKMRSNPQDLEVRKMPQQQMKLTDIVSRNFSDKYFVLSQVHFDELFYSPRMSKTSTFNKYLSTMKSDIVLIDKRSHLPVITIQITSSEDKKKEAYINGAGLGCLYFSRVDDEKEVVSNLQDALKSIEDVKLQSSQLSPA
ncbi:C4-dicarboxylate transporter [Rahnella inusitata]|nr:C4-dicarboxylate transporter [Rahnella inusitata]